jgi:hypothetical protein
MPNFKSRGPLNVMGVTTGRISSKRPNVSNTPSEDTGSVQKISNANGFVHIEKKVVKNMGDYQSAHVTIGLCLPLNYTQADLEAAQKNVEVQMEFVDTVMAEQVEELMEPGVTEEWINSLTRNRKVQ